MDDSKKIAYSLGLAVLVVLIFTIWTAPPLVSITAGFFPLLVTVIIALGMFQQKKPIPNEAAISIPIVLGFILGLLGILGDQSVFGQLEVWYLAIANILGGLGVMAIMTDFMLPNPLASTPSHIKHHIEEVVRYTYAMNEVINRVYTHQRGATPALRKKIYLSTKLVDKLEREFNKKNYEEAHHIVYQLYEQLRQLFEPEHTILGKVHLTQLNRDHHGQSRVVDVLINNDFEAVRRFVETLTHSLQNLNAELLEMRK